MKERPAGSPQKFNRLVSFLLIFALGVSGCVDLKAIRAFSEISSQAAAYTTFTDDYVRSIERQKSYQPEDQQENLEPIIKEREAQRDVWLAIHKEISAYMTALAKLSSDHIISYDNSLGEMSRKMETIKDENGKQFFKKEEVDAFGGLARLLAKAATDSYREKELKEIIESSNKDFQVIIALLKRFMEMGYVESLKNEKVAVKKYYEDLIEAAKLNPDQQAAIEFLSIDRQGAIDKKRKAAESYVKILNKIGEGHQLLYDKRSQIESSKKLMVTMKVYEKDISALFGAVKKMK
ncbi:MAG: hypothetical protein ABSB32_21150 [Thermodesulfobacteriota bacterium]